MRYPRVHAYRHSVIRPQLVHLECRETPAVLVVNTNLYQFTPDANLSLIEAVFAVNKGNTNGFSAEEKAQITGAFGSNDTIQFAPGVTSITLAGEQIDLTKSVTIGGPVGASLVQISGNQTSRIFQVTSGITVQLNDLKLVNAKVLGGNGGAVVNFGGTLSVSRCVFNSNSATDGAGLFSSGTTTISDSTFTGNTATNAGGGIANQGKLSVSGSALLENTSGQGGGAIVNVGASAILSISSSTISGNTAIGGGGLYNLAATATVSTSTISGNHSQATGGGIRNDVGSSLTILNSTISGNSAGTDGGGVSSENNSTVSIVNSTFSANTAGMFGGGINLASNTLKATNATITNNRADADGDGIGKGGGVYNTSVVPGVIFHNTIVAGNFVGKGTTDDNLAGNPIDAASSFNLIGGNPLLGPLQNNGGPTKTHALLTGSPAINAGSNAKIPAGVTQDQRLVFRISGGTVDIGAVERQILTSVYREFGVGGDSGSKTATLYNPNGSVRFNVNPFDSFTGGIRTAAADFTGDGIADLVVGTGPGRATQVQIFNGVDLKQIFTIDPFEATFTGGVYVAAGDITGDGIPELIITPDEGGGPRVRVFNGKDGSQIADFFGIEDPNFRGGARAAVGDLNADGNGDLVVAAGFGGGPRVAVFDGGSLGADGGPKLFGDFFVFEQTLRNGIFVAAGDVNGDGFADLIAGGGPGGGPRVFILNGQSLVQNGTNILVPLGNYFAGDPNSRGGVRVAVKDLDGDERADVVAGAGTSIGSRVTAYLGVDTTPLGGTPPAFLDFDAFPGFGGGVFVG
jgi:hypothetical protein